MVSSRLAANWRTDWQRGPSVPSMDKGRPITRASTPHLIDDGAKNACILGELGAPDGAMGGGHGPGGVGKGQPDGFGSDIEAQDSQFRLQVPHLDDGHAIYPSLAAPGQT